MSIEFKKTRAARTRYNEPITKEHEQTTTTPIYVIVHNIAVEDQMFLEMHDFDFAQI